MKSQALAAVIAAAALIGASCVSSTASAQPVYNSPTNYLVPVVIGAAAGATVGALLWPAAVPAGAVMAAAPEAVPAVSSWGWGAFMTSRAAVGAVIGGGLGYLAAR